jgi:hypothetical protein
MTTISERPPLHPACAAYPPLPAAAFADLVADLKANGQRDTIVMFDSHILDGRLRWEACLQAGLTPRSRQFGDEPGDGDDPVRFVLSKNQHRRHMSVAQKAFAAATIATLLNGSNRYEKKVGGRMRPPTLRVGLSRDEAANAFGTNRSAIRDARAIRTYAPELEAKVLADEMALSRAGREAYKRVSGKNKQSAKNTKPARPKKPVWVPPLKTPLRNPTRDEMGRPPLDIALEEHPDHPGYTRDWVHTSQHGVQTRSKKDAEQVNLVHHFAMLWGIFEEILHKYPDSAEKWSRLTPDNRNKFNCESLLNVCTELNALSAVYPSPRAAFLAEVAR